MKAVIIFAIPKSYTHYTQLMRSVLTLILFSAISLSSLGQSPKLLFTYGNDSVYTDEFMRVFLKNNRKDEQTDSSLRAYLDLYINFKLKVKEATSQGMGESPAFIQELAGYREQLSRSYMTDTSLTSRLMKEAYQRMKEEIHASHILVLVGPNALPRDTMKAYKRIQSLREKAVNGANFDTLAYYNSEDISAKNNLGDLGYFSAFDMIYPFESQAFQTNTGEISPIFRTEFGYHILKVKEKRPYRGEVKVSHLMLRLNTNPSPEEVQKAKRKIDSLYAQLKAGADWGTLVKTYSEDVNSSNNNGDLNWIRTNSPVATPFREAAFALENEGDISEPVLTDFGWHIIRLNERRGLAPFEEIRDRLKMQVNREPERVKMSEEALVKRFKAENGFTENPEVLKAFIKQLDSSLLKGQFKAASVNSDKTPVMFTIGDRSLTTKEFAAYLEKYQTPQKDGSTEGLVNSMYHDFVAMEVLQYQKDHLEEKYPDFRYLMQEYHDGILLFNLTEKKVWDKAVEDTAGLKEFYEQHKQEYMWGERVVASVYECNSKSSWKMTRKLLRKGLEDVEISQQVNEKDPLSLVIKQSKFEKGENSFVDQVKWKPGTYSVKNADGKYVVVVVKEVLPAGPKKFSEIKGLMTGKYQDQLERNWIEELKSKYPVDVREEALNGLLNP